MPRTTYTASDFFDAVEEAAQANARTTIRAAAKTTSDVNDHVDEVGSKLARGQAKASAKITSDINDHVDEVGSKLARGQAKASAKITEDVNDHSTSVGQKLARLITRGFAQTDDNGQAHHEDITNRLDIITDEVRGLRGVLVHLLDGTVPLWYVVVSIMLSAGASFFAFFKWLCDMCAPVEKSEILRDAAGNNLGKVTMTLESTTPEYVPVLCAIAIGAIILGILFAVGAAIFAARARRRFESANNA